MTLAPGYLLNHRYRIISILGQGGMGAVYRAIDENLNVPIAVKENLFLTDEYARQFQREASILASLRHPHLPRVGDYFTIPNQGQYLIMDFIEGEDLRQRIERLHILPEKDVMIIGALTCEALTYLHFRRPPVIHRDIKPGNIKINPEGEVFLVDFGLAKVMQGSQATTTGARAMTPGYSPPEQYGTARTDPRSDVYSLGATLYAALTGAIPEDSFARATGKTELTPVRDLQPKVNRRLASALEKALEVEPEDRFQSAEEFRQELLAAAEMTELSQNRITVPPPPTNSTLTLADAETAIDSEGNPSERPASGRLYPNSRSRRQRRNKLIAGGLILITLLAVMAALLVVSGVVQPGKWFGQAATAVPTAALTAVAFPTATPAVTLSPTALPVTPQPTQTPAPTVSPTANITVTPIGGGVGQIAFASERSGTIQIYLMDVYGQNLKSLTDIKDGACQPTWAPDGSALAFISPCKLRAETYPGARIYLMDADGSNLRPAKIPPNPEGDFDPAWAPDGMRLAYTSLRGGRTQIYVANLDDGSFNNITGSAFLDARPAWSPDGSQIAFARISVSSQIVVMTDRGENQTLYNVTGNYNSTSPAWLPDGSAIYYSQSQTNGSAFWMAGLRWQDRGRPLEFRIPPNAETGPVSGLSFSPDGTWMVFEGWPDGKNHEIYRMTTNGGTRTPIATDASLDFTPAWRPQIRIK